MGSYCSLSLDDTEVTSEKWEVPVYLSAVFQESDRTKIPTGTSGYKKVVYCAKRLSILKRLDLMGVTENIVRQRFNHWKNEMYRCYLYRSRTGAETDAATRDALFELDWESWQRRVPNNLINYQDKEGGDDAIDRQMRGYAAEWLWFDGYDSLISVRAIIQGATHIQNVTLDVHELWDRMSKAERQIGAGHNRIISVRGQPIGPALILAGSESHIAILKASLRRFHPDLEGFVKVFDPGNFSDSGNAQNLIKLLKAFAAAEIPAQIVAVFDNDTNSRSAYRQAKLLNLPTNIACLRLPNIKLGRKYPTVGPLGNQISDVNGRGGSIELYLGRQALTTNGVLRPVQWTYYNKTTETYHGEVEDKVAIRKTFLKEMQSDSEISEIDYHELMLVWENIFKTIKKTAQKAQNRTPSQSFGIF